MAAIVVLIALIFWAGVFTVFFTSKGVTAGEFFFGRYEPLPDDASRWTEKGIDPASGLLREERLLLPNGDPAAAHLLLQVRHRHPTTRAIIAVDPERRLRRRRVSTR